MKKFLLLLFASIFLFPQATHAVPPPDFIMQVASQIGSFFSIVFVFLLAVLTTSYQFLKVRLAAISKKTYWIIGIVLILILAAGAAYYWDQAYQEQAQEEAFQEWVEESQKNANSNLEILIDEDENLAPSLPNLPENEAMDPGEALIRNYYKNLAEGHFEEAYEVSKKSVPFEIFSSWYLDTQAIEIHKIEKIHDSAYRVQLTLTENNEPTHYETLFILKEVDGEVVSIEDSQVSIVDNFETGRTNRISETDPNASFWNQHKSVDLKITNQDFAEALSGDKTDYVILDAREAIEYENGRLPGSLHIRFADLKAGQWKELPDDKFIYILCWSGIRGKEVAEFLRQQGLVARYLENGSDGWVSFGGQWEGEIAFSATYSDLRYSLTFDTQQVKEKIEEGVKIVDSRPPKKFTQGHLPGSVNIPLMYTSTQELETTFAQLAPGGQVITVCDDYVNCFDARLTGVELERRGYEFLGRYNEPWEF